LAITKIFTFIKLDNMLVVVLEGEVVRCIWGS